MIALFVILIPLAFAVVTGLTGTRRSLAVLFGLVSTLATFALALFLPGSSGVSVPWIPGFGATFTLQPGGAGVVLTLVAALTMIPTVLVAARRVERAPGVFVALLLVMQAGLAGVFLAGDLILFYVAWEVTLIPSLLLLGMFGRDKRRAAVLKYLVYAIGGSFLMLISILAIKPLSGAASYRFADLMAATPHLAGATQVWLFVGLAIGMAVKLPMWPLHSWLIDFNEQNHPSGAADVAGTLYKVGAFGFFAWAMPLLPIGVERVGPVLLALAVVTALYGALAATAQTDFKRLLAYASLSHMGIVGVGIFGLHLAGLNGAIFLLAAQMLSTGGLFLISGMLYERRHSFDLDKLRRAGEERPGAVGPQPVRALHRHRRSRPRQLPGRVPQPVGDLPATPLARRPRHPVGHRCRRVRGEPLPAPVPGRGARGHPRDRCAGDLRPHPPDRRHPVARAVARAAAAAHPGAVETDRHAGGDGGGAGASAGRAGGPGRAGRARRRAWR